MPEEAEAENAPENVGPITLGEHLRHHCQQPQQASGHVQAMAANQRKEGREERASCWARPACDQARKLAGLEADKRGSEYEGRRHRAVEPRPAVRLGADACEAAGEAREEQAGRLDPGIAQVEQLPPARPAGRLPDQYRVGREEGGEHDDVAKQENPEAVTDDDALRHQLTGRAMPIHRLPGVLDASRIGATGSRLEAAHGAVRSPASASLRALRLARSMRATDSAEMTPSCRSRQAKTTKVAYAPNASSATINQMGQIRAKPMKDAKKEQLKPVGLFRGISMSA